MGDMRLLHCWMDGNCEPHNIALPPLGIILERFRPMQLYRICQVGRLNGPDAAQSTAVAEKGVAEFGNHEGHVAGDTLRKSLLCLTRLDGDS